MPCYRCDIVQTDPPRGASPWQRGVIADRQVLICPVCQQSHDWRADLDRCAGCGSTRLARRLGETSCSDCGRVGPGLPGSADVVRGETDRPLAAQVETALERVLRAPPA
ncbi:MAG: hypothetical protein ABIM89_09455 [Mycobacteriales bacterium]